MPKLPVPAALRKPGKPGTRRTLTFGVVNEGTASVYRRDGKPVVLVDVTLPKGVTALDVLCALQLSRDPATVGKGSPRGPAS